jgi:hypothetical protein
MGNIKLIVLITPAKLHKKFDCAAPFGELRKHFPVVLPLQDHPFCQVGQSFRSSAKGAAQSNSSSEEGEGAKCRLLDFTQSGPSPYL